MADQEVIKHTKKVISIWGDKTHSFWHKVREFLLEILIIVFAVSLSIWLHDRSEHKHQQKETKEFLLGLREDLRADIKEMILDRESYTNQGNTFSYIIKAKMGQALNKDSLQKYSNWLLNTTGLVQNNGRFEGFKASGKIGTIEDKQLQNNIMDLYQEDIPNLLISTNVYIARKNTFFDYIQKNRKQLTDSTSNLPVILMADESRNICWALSSTAEIIERYTNCITKMSTIVATIEGTYKLKEEK
jgi:hypothetical protein